jgi:CTP synthase
VTAHQAIPRALSLAGAAAGGDVTWKWIHTTAVGDPAQTLEHTAAIWIVPASPYADMAGALAAIRWAREMRRPLLGTCGGFQHLLIEFARNVAGIRDADHAETNPSGQTLLVTPLACSLVEKSETLKLAPGSRIRAAYGSEFATEGYRCNYGVNPEYRATLEAAGLRFTAFDESGTPRAAELPADAHPFFVGTLFQPERAALRGITPPLARALVEAAINR